MTSKPQLFFINIIYINSFACLTLRYKYVP